MANPKGTYRTTSLNHAAYLVVRDILLTGIEPAASEPDRFIFVFEDSVRRGRLSSKFLVGQGGNVNVHRFLECQRQLKQILHEPSLR